MIFSCGFVEMAVIDADTPSCDRPDGNLFALVIELGSESSFLWYYLCRADPFAVADWLDDSCIKQFDYLLLYCFLHDGV